MNGMSRRILLFVLGAVAGVAGIGLLLFTEPEPTTSQHSVPEHSEVSASSEVFPGNDWDERDPRTVGVDPEKLSEFRQEVGWGSYGCVVRGGYVVERWDTWIPPVLANWRGWGSASKAFIGALALFAIQEELLSSLNEPVERFGWELREEDRRMTLRQLVDMTSGYTLPEAPSERYAYNDYGVKLFMLTLFERLYGVPADNPESVKRLFTASNRLGPLQFEDPALFSIFSLRHGVPRLNMSACDYARFGLLMMHRGRWKGEQLLDEDLIGEFLNPLVPDNMRRTAGGAPDDYLDIGTAGGGNDATPLGPGVFGYYWWFNTNRELWPEIPSDAFQANGHWNRHALTVIPSLELVVAWRESHKLASEPDSFYVAMNRALGHLVEAVQKPPEDDG